MKRFLLVHYAEIGLKKSNVKYFVEKLRKRLKFKLEKRFGGTFDIKPTLGRFLIPLPDDFSESEYLKVVTKVFGVKNFMFVFQGSADLNELGKQIFEKLPDLAEIETFCVRSKRSMRLSFSSSESERELGAILLRNGIDRKVKMKNPDLQINVEFFNNYGYFAFQKYEGQGGLSPNSQGKLVSLMSAGIDSPVASFRMMRRGARVIFVHFHAYPFTDKDEMDQVKELVEILSDYQADTKLYLIPFGEFQKAVGTNLEIPGKVRTVLYRRMMLRVAERIAKNEQAKGLVTGDSFGQVASQTPENMFAIHDVTNIPLYQPLISFDKEEIIEVAREIGTYEISSLPCKDTCAMFMPRSPELKANPYDMVEYEKNLPILDWIEKVLDQSEIIYF